MSSLQPRARVLDVRPLMVNGDHPLLTILRAVGELAPSQSLMLITPFLPSPLIERMHADGFSARPERRGDGSWQTQFSRE